MNWNELLEDPEAIEASTLERVIAVGAGQTVKGITIELISLELRELGAFGSLRIEFPSRHSLQGMLMHDIVVRDDVETRYAAMSFGGAGMSPGRGDLAWLRHQFSIVPAISSKATRLVITLGRVGTQVPYRMPTPEGSVDMLSEPGWIEGPWKFEVPLSG